MHCRPVVARLGESDSFLFVLRHNVRIVSRLLGPQIGVRHSLSNLRCATIRLCRTSPVCSPVEQANTCSVQQAFLARTT